MFITISCDHHLVNFTTLYDRVWGACRCHLDLLFTAELFLYTPSSIFTASFCQSRRLQRSAGQVQLCPAKSLHLHGSSALQHLLPVLHPQTGCLQPAEGRHHRGPSLAWSGVWNCHRGWLVLVFGPGEILQFSFLIFYTEITKFWFLDLF